MKVLPKIALFLFALSSSAQADLSRYKWRNRILLFSASSLQDDTFRNQWSAYQDNPKKIEDRNLLLFVLVKGRMYDKDLKPITTFKVPELRKKYDLPASFEGLVLIGKDGGVKLKKSYPVEPKVIFDNIDQMPMRQREMRENIDD